MKKKIETLLEPDFIKKSGEIQQQWHGWGSPVGVVILIVAIGLFMKLVT